MFLTKNIDNIVKQQPTKFHLCMILTIQFECVCV